VGVLCDMCAGELDGSVAIAPQQLQLRTQRTGNASLVDVWGQAHPLDERTPVGRADVSHGLVIVQPSVSRAHAVFELRDGWYVRDVGSSSGTFVNDKPVREVALKSGDRVRFGDIELFFVVTETPLPPRPERFDAPTMRAPAKTTEPPSATRPAMTFELQYALAGTSVDDRAGTNTGCMLMSTTTNCDAKDQAKAQRTLAFSAGFDF
jgi:hypothetical protein